MSLSFATCAASLVTLLLLGVCSPHMSATQRTLQPGALEIGGRVAYSPQEVADLLGVSVWAVYRRMQSGDIPTVAFGLRRKLIPALWVYQIATAGTLTPVTPNDEQTPQHTQEVTSG